MLVSFEPVLAPPAISFQRYMHTVCVFHFFDNNFFYTFFFFNGNTEVQFVMYLQDHFGLYSFGLEPLIQEVYHEIDRLHQEPVSAEELTIVRNYMLGEMCRSYESPFSLSDAWIFIATSGLDDDYFSRSLLAVNEVTSMEIQDLAQRYLCKETLKEVIAGKKLS